MRSTVAAAPPAWFRLCAILLVLWGVAGVYAFYLQTTMSREALAQLGDDDRRFLLALPGWFAWVYGIATWGGLLGSVALVLRRRIARAFYALSLLAVAVQFGWVFAATDLIAVKGAGASVPFPLLIFAIALGQVLLARHGIARGWLR